MGRSPWNLEWWIREILLETSGRPKFAAPGDYPSVNDNLEVAVAELYHLSGMSKIPWYPDGNVPADLWVSPSRSKAKPGEGRMVHDWSDPKYGLTGVLTSPEAGYGVINGPLPLLRPEPVMEGFDLQD